MAGQHATRAFLLSRPDLERLRPEQRVAPFERLFHEHAVDLDCHCIDDDEHAYTVLIAAWNELSEALGHVRSPRILNQIDSALSHLDVVLYLFDPDFFSRSIADASASDRVRIAANAEMVELMLEENRAMVRDGRLVN